MAKDPEEKPEPKSWTPDQPLEDADDEAETQRRARAEARLSHLRGGYEKPEPGDKKKKKKLFG